MKDEGRSGMNEDGNLEFWLCHLILKCQKLKGRCHIGSWMQTSGGSGLGTHFGVCWHRDPTGARGELGGEYLRKGHK